MQRPANRVKNPVIVITEGTTSEQGQINLVIASSSSIQDSRA
jgi:hypothetical protein